VLSYLYEQCREMARKKEEKKRPSSSGKRWEITRTAGGVKDLYIL